MDIVNRLMTFMEAHGIGSTQFADSCGIPRPTLSQILSGRNKKISDAVISKIHNAYPHLSVLWLLFGEGQMETHANNALSEPQTGVKTPAQTAQTNVFRPSDAPSSDDSKESADGLFGPASMGDTLIFEDEESVGDISAEDERMSDAESATVAIPADGSKSIVNIMVFYSDNSYQSFVPR